MNIISKFSKFSKLVVDQWERFNSWVDNMPPLEKLPNPTELMMEAEETIPRHQRYDVYLGRPFLVPFGYGAVVFTALASMGLLWYQHYRVWAARKQYRVICYNSQSDSMVFNCTYRAYQGTMEMFPSVIFFLMTGGLDMPYFSSVGGFIWIFGRLVYSHGYYTGVPWNRIYGSFFMIGYLILLFTSGRCFLRKMLYVE